MEEFKPIEKRGDEYVVSEKLPDKLFLEHLEKVFIFYDVSFEKSSEGKILVNQNDYADLDLMYNYTQKANDENWLNSH